MKTLSGERDALDEQLELRKLLDRAKGLLIDQHSLTEQAAFDFIQKMAMSKKNANARCCRGSPIRRDQAITPNLLD